MSHLIYKIRQLYVNVFAEEVVLVVCSLLVLKVSPLLWLLITHICNWQANPFVEALNSGLVDVGPN